MTLSEIEELCLRYLNENIGELSLYESKEGADGMCETASYDFSLWIYDNAVFNSHSRISRVMFISPDDLQDELEKDPDFHLVRNNIVDFEEILVFSYESPPHRWYVRGCNYSGHMAVRIGDFVVDWTARQFTSRAPFPLIFKM